MKGGFYASLTYGHYLDEGKVGGGEGQLGDTPLPREFSLSQNYPNPMPANEGSGGRGGEPDIIRPSGVAEIVEVKR